MSDQKYVWSIHWNIKCFKLGTNGKLVSTFCLSDWCLPWTYQTYLRSTQSTGCCNVACKSMYVTSFSLFTCNPFSTKGMCFTVVWASWNSLPRQCGNMKLMWSILLLVTLTAILVEAGNKTSYLTSCIHQRLDNCDQKIFLRCGLVSSYGHWYSGTHLWLSS